MCVQCGWWDSPPYWTCPGAGHGGEWFQHRPARHGNVWVATCSCCHWEHFVVVGIFCVKAVAFARTSTAGTTGALIGRGLGNRDDLELVHLKFRIENFYLTKTRVHHIINSIYRQRGFGNIGSDDNFSFAGWGRVKNSLLEFTW